MRIDARNGDVNWIVWHCELMTLLKPVVYVDDCENVYGTWFYDKINITTTIIEHKAKKIIIDGRIRTVFINPIGDDEVDEFYLKLPHVTKWQQDAQKTATQSDWIPHT